MSPPAGAGGSAGPADLPPVPVDVAVALVRPLRQAVLRPGRPPVESVYPGDDDPRSAHLAVRTASGEVLAVGSLLPEPPPWEV